MRFYAKKWLVSVAVMMISLFVFAIGVSAASLSATSATLKKGQSIVLTVNNATAPVTWKTSKKSVATVTPNGLVVAKKKGSCKITAKVGSQKLTCKITVKQPVTSIKLNKSAVTVKKGKKYTLKATCKPGNANVRKVTWKSSNTAVATVSTKGVVKAIAGGKAVITATTTDGTNLTAACTVTVPGTAAAPVSSGSITLPAPASLNLANGAKQTVTLTAANVLQYFEPVTVYDSSANVTYLALRNRLEGQGWYNTSLVMQNDPNKDDPVAYVFVYADLVCTKSGKSPVSGTYHTRYTITPFCNSADAEFKLSGKWNISCKRIVNVTGKAGKGVAKETFVHKSFIKAIETYSYSGFKSLDMTLNDGRELVINKY